MNAKIDIKGDTIKIYIDDTLHLYISDRITSIQSYKFENSWWKIEIKTKHNNILLEYDSKTKWDTILKLIDTI